MSCFVWIRRNPAQNALSLLRARGRYLGSFEKWYSMKPAEHCWLEDRPYWAQVAGQVYYLEKSIAKQVGKVGGRNVLPVTYEEVCHAPKAVLGRIKELLESNGGKVDFLCEPPPAFKESLDRTLPSETRRLVEEAVREFYG